jgi:hypothetical protein
MGLKSEKRKGNYAILVILAAILGYLIWRSIAG